MIRFGLEDYIADFGSVFFSLSGLNSSIRTAWLNRRRARDHWVLPGGGREPGETFAETAIREVHEETGVTVRIVRRMRVPAYQEQATYDDENQSHKKYEQEMGQSIRFALEEQSINNSHGK